MRFKLLLLSLPLIVTVKAVTEAQNADLSYVDREYNFPTRNIVMPIHRIPKPLPKPIFVKPLELPAPTESIPSPDFSTATESIQPNLKPMPSRQPLRFPSVRPGITQPEITADPDLLPTPAPLPTTSILPSYTRPPVRSPLAPRPIPSPHLVGPVVSSTESPSFQTTQYPRPAFPYRPTSRPRPSVNNPKPQPLPGRIPMPQPDPIPEPYPEPQPEPSPAESLPDRIYPQLRDPINPLPNPQPVPVWPRPTMLPRPLPNQNFLVNPVVSSTEKPYPRPSYRPTLRPRPSVTFAPMPTPTFEPQPDIIPMPHPDPVPEPHLEPLPEPNDDLEAQPQPEPKREPIPEPLPDPIPAPEPEPQPDSTPIPQPEPQPRPLPVPNPRPAYFRPRPEPTPNSNIVRPGVSFTEKPLSRTTPYPRRPLPVPLRPRPSVTVDPIPDPEPQPQPDIIPDVQPDPIPEPQPNGNPEPEPQPQPDPQLDPIPEPLPDPIPVPQPDPIPLPLPQPQPLPVPIPQPPHFIWMRPEPKPEDKPAPLPQPIPQPIPKPQPIPQPIPRPDQKPIPQPKPAPQPQPLPKPVPTPLPVPQPQPTYRPPTTRKPTSKPYNPTTQLPFLPQPRPEDGVPIEYNCIQDGYYSIANECDTYIECKKRSAMKYVCPDGLNFNRNAQFPEYPCAYPSEVECDSRAPSRDPQPTSQCPRQYGFFPMNDGDCSRYLMCQEGLATIMNCPPGLAFNPQQDACDWPGNVPSCRPSVFQGFTCPPAPRDEYGEPYDWIYKYKYGQSCKEYVACQQGHPRLLSCDPGLAFDEASETCVSEDYVPGCSSPAPY